MLPHGVSQEVFRKHLPKVGITVGTYSQLYVCLPVVTSQLLHPSSKPGPHFLAMQFPSPVDRETCAERGQ